MDMKTKTNPLTRRNLVKAMAAIGTWALGGFGTSKPSKLGDRQMKTILHKANTRGNADHGWLKSKHTFSFASYHNPDRMGFGLLRVINDDQVAPSKGFGTHPHQDMEIISIPLSGSLKHKDSQGNEAVIQNGEVQLMSAGTGVFHSEFNASDKENVNFLQIWVMPEKLRIVPRYDQKKFDVEDRRNKWQTVVSPMDQEGDEVKINQQAWFSLTNLDKGEELNYQTKKNGNGVYFFLLEGEVDLANETLRERDGLGVVDAQTVSLKAAKEAKVLAIEVPLA
jgi:redox-sensitive bicupin YhaK (pirin superfamily)